MRQITLILSALLVLAATLIGVARLAGRTLPWESSTCGNPNAACWTHGRPVYTAIIRRNVLFNASTIRMLNTGPDIPHLIAVIDPHGRGSVTGITASMDTGHGPRALQPRRINRDTQRYEWDLGRVPDGSVVTIRTPVVARGPDITWTQAGLYARLRPNGRPDMATELLFDHAALRP